VKNDEYIHKVKTYRYRRTVPEWFSVCGPAVWKSVSSRARQRSVCYWTLSNRNWQHITSNVIHATLLFWRPAVPRFTYLLLAYDIANTEFLEHGIRDIVSRKSLVLRRSAVAETFR